ncbi:phague integrase [Mycolicibacterium aurum]|uniref:Phague integrase n=1 Tax=Mycolicibacterium aurum TaxID=1791 RepID=A0A3S4S7H6_MYCAU|nr:recombinase family protein [Mycolicibacterium aurum]VEG58152.1 phague integrase [Mycolicibacterium aurum]
MRALIVVRLSRVTDVTTSPERQLQTCRELCAQRGYEVVGVAEDLDVSAGSTAPFDRPQLGNWLENRRGEFDVLVVFRMDRIVRRLLDLADLIRWCQGHSVALVSATEQFLDLTAPFGDIIALLVAKVAEMELSAISERNASAARYNIRAGKYRGGLPPWGYLPEQDETGTWRLVQDPEQVRVITEVARRVLDGEPLRALAHELTERGVPTPKDRFAAHQGRETKGYGWHSGPLKRSLTSPTLLGQIVAREPLLDALGRPQHDAKGKKLYGPETVVRADDGSPVVRADPILSREVFERLGAELADRENRKEPTKRSTGLLLQVIHCGTCGRPAYRLKGGKGRNPRYRCSSAQYKEPCGNKSIPLAFADDAIERMLLTMLGTSERLERMWDSGSDNSAELAEINETLTDLTGLLGSGVYRAGTPQRLALNKRIADLAERQAELSAEAVKPAGWTWTPTGELFGDWWDRQDVTARNVWLRSMGVRLDYEYTPGGQDPAIRLDLGDLFALTEQMNASGPVADWQKVLQAMKREGVQGLVLGSGEPEIVRK